MLPVKKIYIDTKYKTKDSISNSNFKYALPQTMFMPENTVFYVDDVAIPALFVDPYLSNATGCGGWTRCSGTPPFFINNRKNNIIDRYR